MIRKIAFSSIALLMAASIFPSISQANNLTISNVRLGQRDTSAKTVSVKFDLSWENSWRNKINHDAVWVNVRLNDMQSSPIDRRLCQFSASGLNPSGMSSGAISGLEVYVPQDKRGAFLRRANNSEVGSVSATDLSVSVDYTSCGFSETSEIAATVFGLEMVFVPQGAFYAGDFLTSAAAFHQGSADNDPWYISSASAINVTGASADGYYYSSGGNSEEFTSGASFVIPEMFPKGYSSFYIMKYELTEGQWVDFINSLPSTSARSARDLTNDQHKNTDSVIGRNTISCSGNPLVCTTQRPGRPVSFLSWMDLTAFLDWMALRPMTELEFEKAARGPFVPLKGEAAWGATVAIPATILSGTEEDGTESVTDLGANVRSGDILLSGGDAGNGDEYQRGPVRGGIFATTTSDRLSSGAANYGGMELSGNLSEWAVSVGLLAGLSFDGDHGDGYLTTVSGFEGNANVLTWPGMNSIEERGVTIVAGAGLRGGSWQSEAARLRISDRQDAANAVTGAAATNGGRGVRTYDGE